MAGTSLLLLLDDLASILDDVALMTKIAAKKTAGVLGDDLALNAKQVSGIRAERELPVVWAVAKGSLVNKLILVPSALLISWFAAWLITPLLMAGGAYLCFEGFEKLAHRFLHNPSENQAHSAELAAALANPAVDLVNFEKDKIKGAVRTDFVLSAEIIVIALGVIAHLAFATKVMVLAIVALLMTVGVYGLVAIIVKLDDVGLYLTQKPNTGLWTTVQHKVGLVFLLGAPYLMKMLTIVGTAAMFMVGGGILSHGIPMIHHSIAEIAQHVHSIPGLGNLLGLLAEFGLEALVGIIAGALVLSVVLLIQRVRADIQRSGQF